MTAMLQALRTLDARLDRGELTPEEYARRRLALLGSVEEAQAEVIDVTPRAPAPKPARQDPATAAARPHGPSAAGLGLVVVLLVMGLCMALALMVIGNMNLALTLGVTILAALSIALLRHPEG